eukprot:EG_transcript_19518
MPRGRPAASPQWASLCAAQAALFGEEGHRANPRVAFLATYAQFTAAHRLRDPPPYGPRLNAVVDIVAEALLLAAGSRTFVLAKRARRYCRALAVLRKRVNSYLRAKNHCIAVVLDSWRIREAQIREAGLSPVRAGQRRRMAFRPSIVPDELKEGTVRALYRERHTEYRQALRQWRLHQQTDPPAARPQFIFTPANVTMQELVGCAWAVPKVSTEAVERRVSQLKSQTPTESPAQTPRLDNCDTLSRLSHTDSQSPALLSPSLHRRRSPAHPFPAGPAAASAALPSRLRLSQEAPESGVWATRTLFDPRAVRTPPHRPIIA